MPFRPFTIDSSISQVGAVSARVIPGNYLFEVTGLIPSAEEYDKDPYFRWGLKITDGPDGIGKLVYQTTSFSHEKMWNLGRLLNAVGAGAKIPQLEGMTFPSYDAFVKLGQGLLKGLQGKSLGGEIADRESNGKIYSNIVEVYPAAEWDDRKKNNDRPRPSAATPALVGVVALPTNGAAAIPDFSMDAVDPALAETIANMFPD